MELFDDGDDERPIETYPGYLGLYFDGREMEGTRLACCAEHTIETNR
jgi:hypothetical protein